MWHLAGEHTTIALQSILALRAFSRSSSVTPLVRRTGAGFFGWLGVGKKKVPLAVPVNLVVLVLVVFKWAWGRLGRGKTNTVRYGRDDSNIQR
jgi:hypothetical protein